MLPDQLVNLVFVCSLPQYFYFDFLILLPNSNFYLLYDSVDFFGGRTMYMTASSRSGMPARSVRFCVTVTVLFRLKRCRNRHTKWHLAVDAVARAVTSVVICRKGQSSMNIEASLILHAGTWYMAATRLKKENIFIFSVVQVHGVVHGRRT